MEKSLQNDSFKLVTKDTKEDCSFDEDSNHECDKDSEIVINNEEVPKKAVLENEFVNVSTYKENLVLVKHRN